MTRVFHYAGYKPVPPGYFAYAGRRTELNTSALNQLARARFAAAGRARRY